MTVYTVFAQDQARRNLSMNERGVMTSRLAKKLLANEASVFLGMQPEKLPRLQQRAPHPRACQQHQVDLVIFKRSTSAVEETVVERAGEEMEASI